MFSGAGKAPFVVLGAVGGLVRVRGNRGHAVEQGNIARGVEVEGESFVVVTVNGQLALACLALVVRKTCWTKSKGEFIGAVEDHDVGAEFVSVGDQGDTACGGLLEVGETGRVGDVGMTHHDPVVVLAGNGACMFNRCV